MVKKCKDGLNFMRFLGKQIPMELDFFFSEEEENLCRTGCCMYTNLD